MNNTVFLKKIISKKKFNKCRVDKVLSKLFPKYSRSNFKKSILKNYLYVNNSIVNSPNFKIKKGDFLNIKLKIEKKCIFPEDIFLDIIYEDKYLLVINKPSSLVVHPGIKNFKGTLLNGLIYHFKNIKKLPRAGIIHRLDKDTTGLIIVAKTVSSYCLLKKMMKLRKIIRKYKALVLGKVLYGGFVNSPIQRNKNRRTCMTINCLGKKSVTHYKVKKKFKNSTFLKLRLETGRTHQIRVHMLSINHPIVGDKKYKCNLNNFFKLKKNNNSFKLIKNFNRQALHAYKIIFIHPITKKKIILKSKLPKDMNNLISNLK
ncbi:Ribosomal large subunit pseudouridine synthase D [Buchnera aphidicola (Periphyllus testudinaceus)]|uniref:RluA family pseudouridine synthase n=1 Tax=Buchnera aphidicola TaxID=9 RepID=UPI003464B683